MPETKFAAQMRVTLPGSERTAFSAESNPRLPYATPPKTSVKVDASGVHVTVSVVLRRREPVDLQALGGKHLTYEDFAAKHGPDPLAVQTILRFAEEYRLEVEPSSSLDRATVQLTGAVPDLELAFGTKLETRTTSHGKLRVRTGPLTLPEELAPYVKAVLGLDDRPQAKPHFRFARPRSTNVAYTPVQVAQAYNFPNVSAAGQTIALIELGGGFQNSDIETYFRGIKLNPPIVSAISVDKAKNIPGQDPNGADGEVLLDIEVAGATAPGAHLAVYFAPNTDQGFLDAITTAIHDSARKPSVISISWGGPESTWTQQAVTAMDEAFQAAAALGITVTVACGDSGSTDGVTDGANHVDFPASSPHVLACGGTALRLNGSAIASEVVWNELTSNAGATGGGVSTLFAKPTWQSGVSVPQPTTSAGGRGMPDVSGDADPATGYKVLVDGEATVIGGTSAVAPLWAGLVALSNAKNGGNAGFINPKLYATPEAAAFHDITGGNNGAFQAGPGWDPCTGLGSPVGTGVAAAINTSGSTTTGSGKHHKGH